jgi:hypothetical protein
MPKKYQENLSPARHVTMTRVEFKSLEKLDGYYKGRWAYFEKIVGLINKLDFNSVLELGPYRKPMVQGSDQMDIGKARPGLTYRHDATVTPWPMEDKKYDLFIALQVWEHLGDKQQEAFKEVMRISRKAILSFPLNWNCPGDMHHGITEDMIAEWTLGIVPKKKIRTTQREIWKRRSWDRIIYFFDFEN